MSDDTFDKSFWGRLRAFGTLAALGGLAALMLFPLLLVVGAIWVVIHMHRTSPPWEAHRAFIGWPVVLVVAGGLNLTGYWLGRRGSSKWSQVFGIAGWTAMGLGFQLMWYGTPRWNRYSELNTALSTVWFGGLGAFLELYIKPQALRRANDPERKAQWEAKTAALRARLDAAKAAKLAAKKKS